MSSSPIRGKRIAITGGARGIGFAIAEELHARGAEVVIGDLTEPAIAAAIEQLGPGVSGYVIDIADAESFMKFHAGATAAGPLDVLINNAGIMPVGHFLEQSSSVLRKAVEVNLLGCMNGMHTALPDMVKRGSGHIVNVASTAGKTPVPGGMAYCATKAGVVALTETARVEFSGTGVDFTCVMPHFTNTELIAGTKPTKFIPPVQPRDVAQAVALAIVKPKPDVYVPAAMGHLLAAQPLMGRAVRDRFGHFMGAYSTFLDFDHDARSTYDKRITGA